MYLVRLSGTSTEFYKRCTTSSRNPGIQTQAMQTDIFSDHHPLTALPGADIEYLEGFFSNDETLYKTLLDELAWRQDTIQVYGKSVLIPRLNAWYGDPEAHYSYSGLQLTPLAWTDTLLQIKSKVEDYLGAAFNSVLANHYRDGNDSVSWHSDDERELGAEPLIASVSLGAARHFAMKHRRDKSQPGVKCLLEGGSLLVMRGATQRNWHHAVPKEKAVKQGRVNLTFRQILN